MASTAELMKQFYGIQDDDEPVARPPDPTDVDGNAFEAEPTFRLLIQQQNLSTLVQKETQLKSDILDLDSDLQNLVYDNYTKFLLAEETIQQMTDGLNSLSAKMQNVLTSLSSVSERSKQIKTDLKPNREQIQRLVGINRLLDRVDFISQLPLKLRAHSDIGEYEAAVDIWLKAEKVLETQTHYESFVHIREECKSILEDIKVKVRNLMIKEETPSHTAIVSAATLIKLQLPVDPTLEELVKFRLGVELKKLEGELPEDLFELIKHLDQSITNSADSFIHDYINNLQKYSTVRKGKSLDRFIASFKRDLFAAVISKVSEEKVFEMDCEEFASLVSSIVSGVGRIALTHQLEQYTQGILQKYIMARMRALSTKVIEMVSGADTAAAVDSEFVDILQYFKRTVTSLMNEFDVLARAHSDAKDHILQETSKMFIALLSDLEAVDPRCSLLAFGVAHQLGERTIPFVYELVSRFDPDSPLLRTQDMLCAEANRQAGRSLARFVSAKRQMLSEIISQGFSTTDWLEAKTPHDASITCCLVMQELVLIAAQLDSVIGRVQNGSVASAHSSISLSSRTRMSQFSNSLSAAGGAQMPLFHGLREDSVHQIDRLFTTVNHLRLGRAPDFSPPSVITAITMFALKTMLELVREDTFSCAGFNQMQVDAYFIYMTIHERIDDQSLFNALIEELLSSAADRTVQPIPCKMGVLNEIYQRSESKPHDSSSN